MKYTIANALEDLVYKSRNEIRRKKFIGLLVSHFGNHDFAVERYGRSNLAKSTGLATWYWEHSGFKNVLVPLFDEQDKIVNLVIGQFVFGGELKKKAEISVNEFSIAWFLAEMQY